MTPAQSAREPRSPCVSVCRMDSASGLCVGCLRTIDEIAAWGSMQDAERWRVLARVDERRAAGIASPATAS